MSTYPPDSPYTVYCADCWWGDSWDGQDYAMEYDSGRSFMEQFSELFKKVPHLGMNTIDVENSEFTNYSEKNKDCYLVVNTAYNENLYYCERIFHCKDSMETSGATNCQLNYWNLSVRHCYNTQYSRFCENCTNCILCYDCKGGQNCFGSFGLRNQRFMFMNEQLTEKEYTKRVAELELHTHEGVARAEKMVYEHWLTFPHRYANVMLSEDTTGDNVTRSKNSQYIFEADEMENCRYCHVGVKAKDSQYCVPADECEKCYNNMSLWDDYNVNCSYICWHSSDVLYSAFCMNSQNLLGSVGMRNKQFSILNTVYTEAEYRKLYEQIVQELKDADVYGEFLSISLSPFAYNKTVAIEHYPLTQAEAETMGYQWEKDAPAAKQKTTLKGSNVPNSVDDVADSICDEIIECAQCAKPYKILENELTLYRQMRVPVARTCPDCRYQERRARKLPRKLFERSCMHKECGKKLMSAYAPDRPEIIYCEEHYIQEYN